MRPNKYYAKDLTSKTRLIDLVSKDCHPQLKQMIEELKPLTTLTDQTEWWRVSRLEFVNPHTQLNYGPIAKFISKVKSKDGYGLKCSLNTFFHYIVSCEHSNLNTKWDSTKTLVFNWIRYIQRE